MREGQHSLAARSLQFRRDAICSQRSLGKSAKPHEIKSSHRVSLDELECEEGHHSGEPRNLKKSPAVIVLDDHPGARGEKQQRTRHDNTIVEYSDVSHRLSERLQLP